MTKFSIGDTVWHATCQWGQIKCVCPTCFGKREVTLILGNDDHVLLPCGGCAPGYDPPTGYIHEYDFIVKPEVIVITGVSIEIDGDVECIRYRSGSFSFNASEIFATESSARVASEEKKKKLHEEQNIRAECIKKNVHKSFSWNAHYHMREAKRHRKDALYHDEKSILCERRGVTAEASKQ